MIAKLTTLLLLIPLMATAGTGSWSKRGSGITLSVGGQAYAGRWITAPSSLPLNARTTRISWRVTPLSNRGEKLELKLCQEQRCMPLNALSGQMAGSVFSPRGRFRMIYSVARKGRIYPPLEVNDLQLTVNFR